MQKEQIFSAATVDRAIEKALAELHMDRDAVSVEVIEMGRKGFLGIGASDAKIRVTYEVPDEVKPTEKPAAKVEEKPAPKAEVKTEAKPRPAQDDTPRLVKAAPQSARIRSRYSVRQPVRHGTRRSRAWYAARAVRRLSSRQQSRSRIRSRAASRLSRPFLSSPRKSPRASGAQRQRQRYSSSTACWSSWALRAAHT